MSTSVLYACCFGADDIAKGLKMSKKVEKILRLEEKEKRKKSPFFDLPIEDLAQKLSPKKRSP